MNLVQLLNGRDKIASKNSYQQVCIHLNVKLLNIITMKGFVVPMLCIEYIKNSKHAYYDLYRVSKKMCVGGFCTTAQEKAHSQNSYEQISFMCSEPVLIYFLVFIVFIFILRSYVGAFQNCITKV